MGAGKSTARVVTRKYYPRPGSIFMSPIVYMHVRILALEETIEDYCVYFHQLIKPSAVFCDAVTMALPSASPPVVAAAPQKRRCSNTFLADVI